MMIIVRKVNYDFCVKVKLYSETDYLLIITTDLATKQITVQKRLREALKHILLERPSTAGVTNWLYSSCVRR